MLQHLTKALYVGLSFTLISVHSLVSRTVSSKLGGQAVVFQRYFLRNMLEICFVWGFYFVYFISLGALNVPDYMSYII